MKLTKTRLKEIIREELLSEKRYKDTPIWKGVEITLAEKEISTIKNSLWEIFEFMRSEYGNKASAENAFKAMKKPLLKLERLIAMGKK